MAANLCVSSQPSGAHRCGSDIATVLSAVWRRLHAGHFALKQVVLRVLTTCTVWPLFTTLMLLPFDTSCP